MTVHAKSTFMTMTRDRTKAATLSERYRPKEIADCVLLPEVREAFQRFISKDCAPHILLLGPPGVGKTSLALALATATKWEVIVENAAAYANVEAVRTEIRDFALTTFSFHSLLGGGHRCLILDEADHIPARAQAALRGIMEEAAANGDSTFILTANDEKKIDPAIRSRCAVFDFSYSDPNEKELMTKLYRERIANILEAEGLEPDGQVIDRLLAEFFPDLRAILNEVQKHT